MSSNKQPDPGAHFSEAVVTKLCDSEGSPESDTNISGFNTSPQQDISTSRHCKEISGQKAFTDASNENINTKPRTTYSDLKCPEICSFQTRQVEDVKSEMQNQKTNPHTDQNQALITTNEKKEKWARGRNDNKPSSSGTTVQSSSSKNVNGRHSPYSIGYLTDQNEIPLFKFTYDELLIVILAKLKHKNIVHLYGALRLISQLIEEKTMRQYMIAKMMLYNETASTVTNFEMLMTELYLKNTPREKLLNILKKTHIEVEIADYIELAADIKLRKDIYNNTLDKVHNLRIDRGLQGIVLNVNTMNNIDLQQQKRPYSKSITLDTNEIRTANEILKNNRNVHIYYKPWDWCWPIEPDPSFFKLLKLENHIVQHDIENSAFQPKATLGSYFQELSKTVKDDLLTYFKSKLDLVLNSFLNRDLLQSIPLCYSFGRVQDRCDNIVSCVTLHDENLSNMLQLVVPKLYNLKSLSSPIQLCTILQTIKTVVVPMISTSLPIKLYTIPQTSKTGQLVSCFSSHISDCLKPRNKIQESSEKVIGNTKCVDFVGIILLLQIPLCKRMIRKVCQNVYSDDYNKKYELTNVVTYTTQVIFPLEKYSEILKRAKRNVHNMYHWLMDLSWHEENITGSSARKLVSTLLFRAGIELNPGPNDRNSPIFFANESNRIASYSTILDQLPFEFSALRLAVGGLYAKSELTGADSSPNTYQMCCFACDFKFTSQDRGDPMVLHRQKNAQCHYLIKTDKADLELDSTIKKKKDPLNRHHVEHSDHYDNASANDMTDSHYTSIAKQADALGGVRSFSRNYSSSQMFQSDSADSPGVTTTLVPDRTPLANRHNGATDIPTNQANLTENHSDAVRRALGYKDNRFEICRLETYRNWPPNAAVKPDELANAGFYFMLNDDRVQCVFCRGILRNWEAGDKPLAEHLRHFPLCPFLTDPVSAGNVPLGQEEESVFSRVELRQDQSGVPMQLPPGGMTGISTDRPRNPVYSNAAERIATFNNFPSNALITADELSNAGFYYTNITDTVRCFYCDVQLNNWLSSHDPWMRHAQASPNCGFIRITRGETFVTMAQHGQAAGIHGASTGSRKPRRKRGARKYPVNTSQVDKLMKSKTTAVAIQMGCQPEVVKKVIQRRLAELGDEFPNPESLNDECMDFVSSESEPEDDPPNVEPNRDRLRLINNSRDSGIGSSADGSTILQLDENAATNRGPPTIRESDPLAFDIPTYTDEKSLLEETQRLKEERTCKVCLDQLACIVFLKCGHLVCCSTCAPALRHCPICRMPILGTIKVDVDI